MARAKETFAPGERTLHPGDTGPDVKAVQAALGVKVTGEFDDATVESVKRLQRLRGLPQQGTLGPATWPYVLEGQVEIVTSPTVPETAQE